VQCRETKSAPATRSSTLAEALGSNEGVVGSNPHLEAARAPGDLLADPPEPDQAERLVGELEPGEARTLPAAGREHAVGLRDPAGEREQEREGVLRGGDDRGLRRVGDDDAALRGRRQVDVVHADACAADHLEPVGALDQVGRQLRPAADDDRVVVGDRARQVAVRLDVHVEAAAEEVDSRLRDRLPDENPAQDEALSRRAALAGAMRRPRLRP
jgi:hypothetical protein